MLPEPFNFEAKLPHFCLVSHQTGEARHDSTLVQAPTLRGKFDGAPAISFPRFGFLVHAMFLGEGGEEGGDGEGQEGWVLWFP